MAHKFLDDEGVSRLSSLIKAELNKNEKAGTVYLATLHSEKWEKNSRGIGRYTLELPEDTVGKLDTIKNTIEITANTDLYNWCGVYCAYHGGNILGFVAEEVPEIDMDICLRITTNEQGAEIT